MKKIPWILSSDVYGSPGLDLIYRRAPGHEIAKKSFGVNHGFLRNLVRSSLNKQAYTLLLKGEERIKSGLGSVDGIYRIAIFDIYDARLGSVTAGYVQCAGTPGCAKQLHQLTQIKKT